jgi:hypothetical protein
MRIETIPLQMLQKIDYLIGEFEIDSSHKKIKRIGFLKPTILNIG